MINHHPKSELLNAFVCGDLPASLSAALSIHLDFCPHCKQRVNALTEEQAEHFEFDMSDSEFIENADIALPNIDDMINSITANNDIVEVTQSPTKSIKVDEIEYQLPRALSNVALSNWVGIGKLNRSRVDLNEGGVHTSLLQIKPGGKIPEHTHNGYELTLLLDGHFKDEMGEYHPGDFIWLDGEHTHNPVTENGCLCLTVVSDKLQFTQGLSKLLNPVGGLLY